MSQTKTVKLQIDSEDALKRLDDIEKELTNISKTSKKTEKGVSKLGKGFKGMGLAVKALGIGLVMKAFNKLSEALMKNQAIADTVETVFNSIGLVFKLVTDAIVGTISAVSKSSENFDALGRIAKNVLDIALAPLKLAFHGIKLGIQSAMLAFEKSMFGGKDQDKIKNLTQSINNTKASIKEAGEQAIQSGKEIVVDFKEGVEEVKNIGKVAVDTFKETFEGVTVKSIIEQGKAITQTKKNYGLLALEQARLIEQYDREAEVLRQQRDDIRLTVDERIAANDKLAGVLEKQTQAEKDAIQAQIDSVKQLNDLEGETNERMEELFSLKTEMIAIDAKIAGLSSEQKTNEAALQDERIANLQELTSIGKSELEKQKADIQIEAENRKTLAMRTIEDELLLQQTLIAINQDAADQIKAIDDRVAEEKRKEIAAEREMRINASMDIFNSLQSIRETELNSEKANLDKKLEDGLITQEQYDKKLEKIEKKAEERQKKQALVQILVSTAQGISKAIAAGAGLVFPANLGAILAGVAAVVGGMASAKAALSDAGGDSGGEPETPQMGGLGGESLLPNMEAVDQPTLGATQPAQAYVVESDISNAQSLQNELDLQSTL